MTDQEKLLEDYIILAKAASRLDDVNDDLAEALRSHLDQVWANLNPETTGLLRLGKNIEEGDILHLVLGY